MPLAWVTTLALLTHKTYRDFRYGFVSESDSFRYSILYNLLNVNAQKIPFVTSLLNGANKFTADFCIKGICGIEFS